MYEDKILDLEKRIISLEERVSKIETLIGTKPEKIQKRISIKEFYLTKNPKDDIQRTLLLAYYLERFDGFNSLNTKDVEKACEEARVKIPVDNVPYKLFKNAEKGYLMESKEKKDGQKAYILTNTGEKLVEDNFPKIKK